MRNTIKIDVSNPTYFNIENLDDGTNSIFVQFSNFTITGKCEVYYGDAYYTELQLDNDGMAEIPAACYNDGANMHIRYENGTITGFIHITGDGSKYDNIALVMVSDCIAAITGSENKVISDYGAALAAIISNHTLNDNKDCYEDLNGYRKQLIQSINSMGGTATLNATIEDINNSLIELDTKLAAERAAEAAGRALIAAAITAKGVDTSSSDSILTIINNITNIPSDGYGVSGYVDTTISAAGGIVAIYGLYTVEEQEAS